MTEPATNDRNGGTGGGRVVRHLIADRLYHWAMAISIFLLMGTAFLPILGIKFEWLEIHWISGVTLTVLVLIHIVRALFWQDWRSMLIVGADVRDMWRSACRLVSPKAAAPARPGKYDPLQKLYHLGVGLLLLAVIVTGLLMLLKIDTPLWRRNPYWFSNDTWGYIYVVHGYAAMAIVAAVMIHIYFALRPDEWHLTRSMFRGWISRKEYSEHFDSERWKA
jgi:cytochrome b subunit of formate dehydrogenase